MVCDAGCDGDMYFVLNQPMTPHSSAGAGDVSSNADKQTMTCICHFVFSVHRDQFLTDSDTRGLDPRPGVELPQMTVYMKFSDRVHLFFDRVHFFCKDCIICIVC